MSSRRIRVDGGDVLVLESGQGEPVLFVHGWPLDHRVFKPQCEALQQHFRIINFDRRGFGQSSAPADLRREVTDIATILDALGIDKAHLVGMSQGGRIAIRFATEYPKRLYSLTLQGTAADEIHVEERPDEKIPLEDYVALARDSKLSEVVKRWLAHPMMSSENIPEVARSLEAILSTYSGSDLLQYEAASYAWPTGVLHKLRSITMPVLLMTGAMDSEARRSIATQLLELLPNAREHILLDAGHLCNLTAAAEFNATLEDFLTSVG